MSELSTWVPTEGNSKVGMVVQRQPKQAHVIHACNCHRSRWLRSRRSLYRFSAKKSNGHVHSNCLPISLTLPAALPCDFESIFGMESVENRHDMEAKL